MATVTSSTNRNKRKATQPVRSDKGRKNRQNASTAKVTKDSDRTRNGTNPKLTKGKDTPQPTGKARVTRSSSERPALPPRGGTSANSTRATSQRGWTRHNQATNALATSIQGAARTGHRMSAQDRQDKAAKGTKGKGVRTGQAAPGALVRQQSSAITPASKSRGGAVAPSSRGRSGGTTDGRIQQVRVRDVTPTKGRVSGAAPAKGLPAAQSKAPRASAARSAAPQASAAAASRTTRALGSRGMVGATLLGALLSAPEEIRKADRLRRDPKGAISKALDDHMNSVIPRDQQNRPPTVTPDKGRREAPRGDRERKNAKIRAERIKAATPDRTANDAQRERSQGAPPAPRLPEPTRSSSSSSTRSSGSSATPRTTSSSTPAKPQTSTGTRTWDQFNPGRGTSESNNPLLNRQGGYLRKKMQEREERESQNVGPVKDGKEYGTAKLSAEITARRKAKEEEERKKKAKTGFGSPEFGKPSL